MIELQQEISKQLRNNKLQRSSIVAHITLSTVIGGVLGYVSNRGAKQINSSMKEIENELERIVVSYRSLEEELEKTPVIEEVVGATEVMLGKFQNLFGFSEEENYTKRPVETLTEHISLPQIPDYGVIPSIILPAVLLGVYTTWKIKQKINSLRKENKLLTHIKKQYEIIGKLTKNS